MNTNTKKSGDSNGTAPDSLFWESRLATTLGVPRRRLVTYRINHLTSETDYVRKHGEVVLTPSGLAKMKEAFVIDGKTAPVAAVPALAGVSPPVGPREHHRLCVIRSLSNARLLSCHRVGDSRKKPVLVRVRSNLGFMPGMEFEGVKIDDGLWQYTGHLPRRKGRW